MSKYSNLYEVLDYFKEVEVCKAYFERMRWGSTVVCPRCSCSKVWRTNRGYRCSDKACAYKFTVISGTVLEGTKIPLRIWIAAMYLHTAHKKGVSSIQMAKDLGITQKTAWFLLHRIREVSKTGSLLSGTVEADETYIGGKHSNKHKKERDELNKKGTGYVNKQPVFAMVNRETGEVQNYVIAKAHGKTLQPIIMTNVKKGSVLITDTFGGYKGLDRHFKHETLNHEKDEYVRGNFHTNTVEGYFSQLKRGIYGIYHQVSVKHLESYCNEFAHRYNTRKLTDAERFDLTVKKVVGHRLTYNQLINRGKEI